MGLITEFVFLSSGTVSEKYRRNAKHFSLSRYSISFETSPLVCASSHRDDICNPSKSQTYFSTKITSYVSSFHSCQELNIHIFSKPSTLATGPIQHHLKWVRGDRFSSSPEVKKEWMNISTPLCTTQP